MAHPTPELLFRAWSGDSRGVNSQHIFKPASCFDQSSVGRDDTTPESIQDCGSKLEHAVLWKKNAGPSPFIFFSASLLFVLQLAYRMKAQGQENIYITCINVESATTVDGSPAKFYSVDALLSQFGIEIRNRSDGSKRRYSHEYAAMTSVSPNAGSRHISFNTLAIGGLFDLYPELQAVNQRRNVKLHRAVTDLRAFGFDAEQPLTEEKVDVAARLAFSFQVCIGCKAANVTTDVQMHLFSWFLSLRKRDLNDSALESWLDCHTYVAVNDSTTMSEDVSMSLDDPEILQYQQLATSLKNRKLFGSRISSSSSITPVVVAYDKAAWQVWRQESRGKYRAERMAQDNYQPRKRRFERSRSPRGDRPYREHDYRRTERSRSPRRGWRRRDESYGLR